MVTTVLVFDVNETLLDLSPLRTAIAERLGSPEAPGEWFLRLLHGSLVSTLTGAHEEFGSIGLGALMAVAERRGVPLSSEEARELSSGIRRLPAHPEVPDALTRLRDAGFATAALTNSSLAAARAQLEFARIDDRFDEIMSVDEVGRFKPAPEPYAMAATRMGVSIGQVRMVAAHDWDIAGASAAGAKGAFIARPGQTYRSGLPRPDITGVDLAEVADRILASDTP